MRADLIAWTSFDVEMAKRLTGWETDVAGGEALVEFAGRACYQSWGKPNPETATNEGYIGHILDVGHVSVLEHGVATFYLTGVSRSSTHQVIRHRGFSISELSQRYVDVEEAEIVIPPLFAGDQPTAQGYLRRAMESAQATYGTLVSAFEGSVRPGSEQKVSRKEAREAARAVMPNMTETKIVVTGNYRTWRHFIALRATEHADAEIFNLAVEIFEQLEQDIPHVFQDAERYDTKNGPGVRFPLTVV